MSGMYPGNTYYGPRTKNSSLSDEMRGLLDTIASTESDQTRPDGGYGQAYHTNTSFNINNPGTYNSMGPIDSGPDGPAGRKLNSSAKGRYQTINPTRISAQSALGVPTTQFDPVTQDALAAHIAASNYSGNLEDDLSDPSKYGQISAGLSGQWASLPGGRQPTTSQNRFTNTLADRINNYKQNTYAATASPQTLAASAMAADSMDRFNARQSAIDARNNPAPAQPSLLQRGISAVEAPFSGIGSKIGSLFGPAPAPPSIPASNPDIHSPLLSSMPVEGITSSPLGPATDAPFSAPSRPYSPTPVNMPARPYSPTPVSMPARPYSQTPVQAPAPPTGLPTGIGSLGAPAPYGAPVAASMAPSSPLGAQGIGSLTSPFSAPQRPISATPSPLNMPARPYSPTPAPMTMPARPYSPTPTAPAPAPIGAGFDNGVSPLDNVGPATGFGYSPVGNRPQDTAVGSGPDPFKTPGMTPSNPYANLESNYQKTHPQAPAPVSAPAPFSMPARPASMAPPSVVAAEPATQAPSPPYGAPNLAPLQQSTFAPTPAPAASPSPVSMPARPFSAAPSWAKSPAPSTPDVPGFTGAGTTYRPDQVNAASANEQERINQAATAPYGGIGTVAPAPTAPAPVTNAIQAPSAPAPGSMPTAPSPLAAQQMAGLQAVPGAVARAAKAAVNGFSPLLSGLAPTPSPVMNTPPVPTVGTTNMPAGAPTDPGLNTTPSPTTMQTAKSIGVGAAKIGKAGLAGAKVGSLVGGPIGGAIGGGLGVAGGIANAVMGHYNTNINNLFGGPQPAPGSAPATARDVVANAAPSVLHQVNNLDLGPAPAGYHYGYSPFGQNISAISNNASEASQIAGTGPGILGAFGFGTSKDGYNNGVNQAASNQAAATQAATDAASTKASKTKTDAANSTSGGTSSASNNGGSQGSGKTSGGMGGDSGTKKKSQ